MIMRIFDFEPDIWANRVRIEHIVTRVTGGTIVNISHLYLYNFQTCEVTREKFVTSEDTRHMNASFVRIVLRRLCPIITVQNFNSQILVIYTEYVETSAPIFVNIYEKN